MTSTNPRVLMGVLDSQTQRRWNDTTDQTDLLFSHKIPEQPQADLSAPRVVIALRQCDLDVRRHNCPGPDVSTKISAGHRCASQKHKYPCQSQTIGVKVAAEDIEKDSFNTRLSVWGDGKMRVAGCAWMAYQADDKRFRSGVEKTSCLYQTTTELKIKFEPAFGPEECPTVLAWISGFQMAYEPGAWYLKVSVGKDTTTNDGFTLELTKGEKTLLNQGLFSWLAFLPSEGAAGGRTEPIPLGKPEDTLDPRELTPDELLLKSDFEKSVRKNKTFATAETIRFGKTMKGVVYKKNVMVGISAIDAVWENGHEHMPTGMSFSYRPVKINTKTDASNGAETAAANAEAEEMELLLATWRKSKIRSAEMSWVVVV